MASSSFNCPRCNSVNSIVKDSRYRENGYYGEIYKSRRRECQDCGCRYSTMEVVMKGDTTDQDIEAWKNLGKGVKVDKSGCVIEKNIPILEAIPSSKWTFTEAMEVGDSFVVDDRDRGQASSYMRCKKMKVVTRKLSDGRARIWRAS